MPRPTVRSQCNTEESIHDRYMRIHNLVGPLIIQEHLCNPLDCTNWYAMPDRNEFMCIKHNVSHCCDDGKCVFVNGQCPISGIFGCCDTAEQENEEDEEAQPQEMVEDFVQSRTKTSRVPNTISHVVARSKIAIVGRRVFLNTLECQERVDQWCDFIFEFLSILDMVVDDAVESHACAVFLMCSQEGMVVRERRCLPGNALPNVINIRSVIPEKTSRDTIRIMLAAVDRLQQLVDLYSRYFERE